MAQGNRGLCIMPNAAVIRTAMQQCIGHPLDREIQAPALATTQLPGNSAHIPPPVE